MLVDIGGVHLWDGARWSELIAFGGTWADLPGTSWGSKTPKAWLDYFGGRKWSSYEPGSPWSDWFALRDRIILDGQCSLHQKIQERSTAELTVKDEASAYLFAHGQEVKVYNDGYEILYGGLVTDAEIYTLTGITGDYREHKITSADYHLIAESRTFNAAFEKDLGETLASDIVYAIAAILANAGITVGEIQIGEILEDQLFSLVKCDTALDRLAELCGYIWWIDQNKKLYFVDPTGAAYAAAWDIVDGSEMLLEGLSLNSSASKYRNVQWTEGGNAITDAKTETLRGDNVSKAFPLGFPLAKEPTITVNGEELDFGIKGVESGKAWYWNEGDNTIYQDDTGTPLKGPLTDLGVPQTADVAVVTYYGQFKLICKASMAAEITRNKIVQGFGDGIIEDIYNDSSILSQDSALEIATMKLANYARSGRYLNYKTWRGGLSAGVIQNVTYAPFGLSDVDMLITSMDTDFIAGEALNTLILAEGPVEVSWEKIYCQMAQLAKATAQKNANMVTSIQGLQELDKTWYASEHPNPFIRSIDGVTPSSIDFPCLDDETQFLYISLYSGGSEVFRKVLAEVDIQADDRKVTAIGLILATEANGIVIDHVGIWGGSLATAYFGTGILMDYQAYSHTKSRLEALQFNFVETKGW